MYPSLRNLSKPFSTVDVDLAVSIQAYSTKKSIRKNTTNDSLGSSIGSNAEKGLKKEGEQIFLCNCCLVVFDPLMNPAVDSRCSSFNNVQYVCLTLFSLFYAH